MSPPIRDGSGSSIGSIRLGDGSEIAEVRTGAGDVLFSANVIPDSGDLYHALLPSYLSANHSQGDDVTSWQLNDGSATLTPTTNGSPPSYEDSLVTSDGAAESQGQSGSSSHGDNLQATGVGTLDASTGFTLAVILREDNMGSIDFGGILTDVISSPTWNLRYDQGNYNLETNGSRRTSVNAPTDNNPHTVIVTNINSELRMYLDGGTVGDTDATDPGFSTTDITLFEFEVNGNYYNFGGEIGAVLLYQSGKTESEVGEIHNYLTSL